MRSSKCLRCGLVTSTVAPSGLCATCRGVSDETHPLDSAAPTRTREPDGGSTVTPGSGTAEGVLPAGGYRYVERLGEGGMGVVWRAERVATGQTVAVKKLQPDCFTESGLKRFVAEARALAAVRHPNVVQLFDFLPDPADPLLVLEYVPGPSLAAHLKEVGPLHPDRAARLTSLAARGVQAAHDAGVVHRDLKPANLLLSPDGGVKVADFGLVKRVAEAPALVTAGGPPADEPEAEGLTRTGHLAGGTPGFMAPEQADERFGEVGPAADVWGLGACLYAFLTGHTPFPGGKSKMGKVVTDPLTPPQERNPAVPPDLAAIVVKCLTKEQSNRYPSAAAVADDLDRYLAREATAARPRSRPVRVWQRLRRTPRAVAIAVAVAVLAVTVGITLAMVPKQVAPPAADPIDEHARLREQFLAGEEVVLVPAKGLPRWHQWVVGKTSIEDSPTRDGSAHLLQLSSLTAVKLFDPPSSAYEVSAELRQTSVLNVANDEYRAGLMMFHSQGTGGDGTILESLTSLDYHDWGVGRPANSQTLAMTTWHIFHSTAGRIPAPNYNVFAGAVTTFTGDAFPAKWRRLKVAVTPNECRVYWCDDATDPTNKTALVASYPAATLNGHAAQHRRIVGLAPKEASMPQPLVPAVWMPNGGFGLWTVGCGMSFRNVTVRQLTLPESP
jgi:serine/threonine protein kinase